MPETLPRTRWSLVEALRSTDPVARGTAVDVLVRSYWRPVYTYLRLRWHFVREDAEDLTQEILARAAEREMFAAFDPARGRFRTFLRVAIDRAAMNHNRAGARFKRGGAQETVSFDFGAAETYIGSRIASPDHDPDILFRDEWVRAFFADCVDALRSALTSRGRRIVFDVFERYDLADGDTQPTYGELAGALGIATTQVTNHLHSARKEFRAIVLDRLRQECADDAEFRVEARALLGLEVA